MESIEDSEQRGRETVATAKGRSGARVSVWWWSKYSTAGRYAVRGAASVCGEGGGISLVQRDGRALAVAVAAVVLHVAGLQSTWTQLRSRVNSAILRWTLL